MFGEIKVGDVIRQSSFNSKYFEEGDKKPYLEMTFNAGRGKTFVTLLLGTVTNEKKPPKPDVLLNRLGWVYDPGRANSELEAWTESVESGAAA